jgi:sulfur-oxidizing protein SoxY
MTEDRRMPAGSRRRFLLQSAGLAASAGLMSVLIAPPSQATPEDLRAAIKEVVGGAALNQGKMTLDLPPLVENGNTVPLAVSVDCPMTPDDYVKAIHVFNEKNPQPHVIEITLGPRAGKATVSLRMKLRDSQRIVAVAEMSDGSFWSTSADVIVTIAACIEDIH